MASDDLREVIVRAVRNVSDIVEIADDQGRLEYVNEAFEEKTGWSADEALGQTPASFLRSGEHDERYYEQIWETISGGEPWQGRITSQAKNGSRIIQEAFITPVQDAGGVITHYVAIKRDITERTRLESQLLQVDRLAAVGRLAAGVAHEINNPLTYVLANLSFLQRRLESLGGGPDQASPGQASPGQASPGQASPDEDVLDELRAIINETCHGATQIRDIVRGLGAMTRSNESRSEVNLVEVIDFALRLVDHEVGSRIEVVADYTNLPSVWGESVPAHPGLCQFAG
jgi:PAS domain S-box-containing protein